MQQLPLHKRVIGQALRTPQPQRSSADFYFPASIVKHRFIHCFVLVSQKHPRGRRHSFESCWIAETMTSLVRVAVTTKHFRADVGFFICWKFYSSPLWVSLWHHLVLGQDTQPSTAPVVLLKAMIHWVLSQMWMCITMNGKQLWLEAKNRPCKEMFVFFI